MSPLVAEILTGGYPDEQFIPCFDGELLRFLSWVASMSCSDSALVDAFKAFAAQCRQDYDRRDELKNDD